ncbi:MAG TPA: hypothetical protein VMW27_29515, partial [Thermoanaerobaculia bacterium]|nr:hypothetical protein [Thermoanaerobaculia bacterium]
MFVIRGARVGVKGGGVRLGFYFEDKRMLGKTPVLVGMLSLSLAAAAVSQPLTKSAIQVDPGNT